MNDHSQTTLIPNTSLFRSAALTSYVAHHQEQVVQERISPLLLRSLWLLVAVLSVSLVVVGAPIANL